MQLKPEALNALKLPVKVKAGFLGSVRIEVRFLSSVMQGWSITRVFPIYFSQRPFIESVQLDRCLILY